MARVYQELEQVLPTLSKAVYSQPADVLAAPKVTVRPLVIKGRPCYQMETFKDNKAYHKNLEAEELLLLAERELEGRYRQVLLDLWFQCGAAGWLMDDVTASEVISATPSPANVAGEPEEGPASQPLDAEDGSLSDEALRRLQAASRMPIENLMDRVGGPLAEWLGFDWFLQWPAGLGPDTALWPPENSPDPVALAGGTMSEEDTHKLEQRLQQQYAEYGMELQVVTLTHSVLVLFSGEGSTIGIYYDPVLETWSGIAIQ